MDKQDRSGNIKLNRQGLGGPTHQSRKSHLLAAFRKNKKAKKQTTSLDVCEVETLVLWATDRGIAGDEKPGVIERIINQLTEFEEATTPDKQKACIKALMPLYVELIELVRQREKRDINGKRILQCRNRFRYLWGIYSVSILSLLAALFVEGGLHLTQVYPNSLYHIDIHGVSLPVDFNLAAHVLNMIGPFFWGALGSCVYLLKRISDKVNNLTFDQDQLPGWRTRVLLGSLLGGAVTYLFSPAIPYSVVSEGVVRELGPNVIAFTAGIGTKVIYTAIETVIESAARKIRKYRI